MAERHIMGYMRIMMNAQGFLFVCFFCSNSIHKFQYMQQFKTPQNVEKSTPLKTIGYTSQQHPLAYWYVVMTNNTTCGIIS